MDGSYHIDTALRNFVDRIVEKHEARDDINGDIRELYGEVKEAGFVVSVVRGMVREYRMDSDARAALYQHQNEYRAALGMLQGTPLGDAAEARLSADDVHAMHVERPTPFAEQLVHTPRPRGRPRKDAAEAPMSVTAPGRCSTHEQATGLFRGVAGDGARGSGDLLGRTPATADPTPRLCRAARPFAECRPTRYRLA